MTQNGLCPGTVHKHKSLVAGLDPATQVLTGARLSAATDVDARDKPGEGYIFVAITGRAWLLVTGASDVGINRLQDAALPIRSVDVLAPNIVVRDRGDLINIVVMAGIEPVEGGDIQRHGITPAHASARTTVDPDILGGRDGQLRQSDPAQSKTQVVAGDDRWRSGGSECCDLDPRGEGGDPSRFLSNVPTSHRRARRRNG